MKEPLIRPSQLLDHTCAAYERMDAMARSVAPGSDATDFNERQLVFELGYGLRERFNTSKHWLAFEYNYPNEVGENDTTRCDLLLWERRSGRPHGAQWIEVKSTGLKNGRRRNAFGKLNEERGKDFAKLRGIGERAWEASHAAYWVWLYQTPSYAAELAHFGTSKGRWSKDLEVEAVAYQLGAGASSIMTMPSFLKAVADAAPSSMRVRTDLTTTTWRADGKPVPLSVFIVVSTVAKAWRPAVRVHRPRRVARDEPAPW